MYERFIKCLRHLVIYCMNIEGYFLQNSKVQETSDIYVIDIHKMCQILPLVHLRPNFQTFKINICGKVTIYELIKS